MRKSPAEVEGNVLSFESRSTNNWYFKKEVKSLKQMKMRNPRTQHKCIILFIWQLVSQVSETYRFPVYEVQTCPTSNQSWYRAGAKLNCSYDKNQRLQYLCIPDENTTTLVQFCYDNIMGLFEKGHCLYLSFSGFINQVNCSMFEDGCPERHYISSDIYKYSKCMQINTARRCYKAVPACKENKRSKPVDPGDMSVILIICAVAVSVLVVFGLILLRLCWKKKSKSYQEVPVEGMEMADDNETTYRDIDILQCGNKIVLKAYTKSVWRRNGCVIDAKRNRKKYRIDSYGNLFIYNLTGRDQGLYQYITNDNRKSYVINIEIQEIKFGNRLFCPDLGASELEEFVEIYGTSKVLSVAKDICKMHTVIVIHGGKTRMTGSTSVQKTFWRMYHDSDWMIFLYFAVLVSDDCVLRWSEINKFCDVFEEMKHIFTKAHSSYLLEYASFCEMCISRQKEFPFLVFSNEEGYVKFESKKLNRETFQALLGICKVPKLFLDYIFDKKLSSFITKYLRLPSYGGMMSDLFVSLPSIYVSRYLEVLIKIYMEGNSQSSSELSSIIENDTSVKGKKSTLPEFIMEYAQHYQGNSLFALVANYFRSANYAPERSEICICLPEEYTEKLVDCLGIDILIHPTFQDVKVQSLVVERYKIPIEVISWSKRERERFLTVFKSESKAVFRARGMIIGCAGAGKTSLLREIQHQKKNTKLRESPHSTVGLEVFDNMFIIENGTFKDALSANDLEKKESKTLSITDFAGQSAYYACHQVYLSRRALYLLVVDMSKELDTVPSTNNEDESGSLFERWSYKDFFLFWLQTISTYCKDWVIEENSSSASSEERELKEIPSPVLVIATHADLVQRTKTGKKDAYYKELENLIPENQNLKRHICRERYFKVGLPPKKPWKKGTNIENIRRAIVHAVESLPHWGERIPVLWERFEGFVEEKKKLKVIERKEVEQYFKSISSEVPVNVDDVLKFYHEIGLILHFPQRGLREIVILDIQWFVDAFKHIISDPIHFDKHFNTMSE